MKLRQLIGFLVVFEMFCVIFSQKAVVFSSSIGFYNYRQTSNALKVYHKIKDYGFSDSDILLMIPQNTGCCQKNPLYGSVSFIDNDYTNINSKIQINSDYTDINMPKIIDQMRMKFQAFELIKSRIPQSLSPQPLFIYITGHGQVFSLFRGNTYFKIRQREAIIIENFKHLFIDLALSQRFSAILLLSDSCSAITPFEDVNIKNFTAFASSQWDQKSQSHGFDHTLNAPKSDDFTFYLMEYLEQHNPRQKILKLKNLYEYMSFDKLKVHSKVVGNGKKNTHSINEFIVKKQNSVVKSTFRLQNII